MSRSVQRIYGRNIDDPSAYDLFFDVGVLPIHDVMAAIKAALLVKDSLNTEDAVKALQMKALAKKVRAGIVTNPKLYIPVFDVLPGDNQLLVTGIVHNPEERKKVEIAVKTLLERSR
jgi:predicted type IV restriction endonuclease